MRRTIIIWGAGRIGRGFVADIFDSPDWQTVFVDIDKALIEALNARGNYTIIKAASDGVKQKQIANGFRAIHTGDAHSLDSLFLTPDLVLDIAVHAPKLEEVADMLAPLLCARAQNAPDTCMDILMNVNMPRPDARFQELLRAKLDAQTRAYFDTHVGVTGIFAMCISPFATEAQLAQDPLAILNNGYPEQAIDETRLKCAPPRLPMLRLCKDVEREETRKLYTLNMAHALICYLGLPMGLTASREAALDARLRGTLKQALDEAGYGLSKEYGFDAQEMDAWAETIVKLLENPYIGDAIDRLGADSRRKLGAWDRLVGPARLCVKHGKRPDALIRAIRAGFMYEHEDEGTRAVRTYYKAHGLDASLSVFCSLQSEDALYQMIICE